MTNDQTPAPAEKDIDRWLGPVPNTRRELAQAMAEQARGTAAHLADARRVRLPLQEVAITDALLIRLATAIPGLEIRPLTQVAEGSVGADWEFWIEGERQWFAFLVQAKKSKLDTHVPTYDVGYPSGHARIPQVYLLHAASASRSMPAVYAFYNDLEMAPEFIRRTCRTDILPVGVDGISTLSVGTVYWLFQNYGEHRRLPVEAAAEYSFPWSCLAGCPAADVCLRAIWPKTATDPKSMGFITGTPDDDVALATARAVHEIEKAHWLGTYSQQATQATLPRHGVRDQAPGYVPRPGQDREALEPYPDDGFPPPNYVVALWRPRAQGKPSALASTP